MEQESFKSKFEKFHDKYYKLLLIIPLIILILSFFYISKVYSQTGDVIYKDVSLSGGTAITLNGDVDIVKLEKSLSQNFSGISLTTLTDISTRKPTAVIIQLRATVEELKPEIEKILGYKLDDKNSSVEFSGPSLGNDFYKQLLIALTLSFILMSIVIFVLFRTFVPSIAVIFSAFSDIVMPLALIDYFGIRISAAGIAAFLMLVGYSVDTDILLTTRVLKTKEGSLNHRIFGSFKTGMFMTTTALVAVLPAFLLLTSLPDSFRQIFIILSLGLLADILNTWLTNVSVIKWYCKVKNIQ